MIPEPSRSRESDARAVSSCFAPLLLGGLCLFAFFRGVRPAVVEARAQAERRQALRSENALLQVKIERLSRESHALLTDPFYNERMRRLAFRTGPRDLGP